MKSSHGGLRQRMSAGWKKATRCCRLEARVQVRSSPEKNIENGVPFVSVKPSGEKSDFLF